MHTVRTPTSLAFVIEEGNLQRIAGILHDAANERPYTIRIVVRQQSKKASEFSSVEGLLKHDNPIADPICYLAINASYDERNSFAEVGVSAERFPHLTSAQVSVSSEDQRWANALSAELQEQVERIRIPGLVYRAKQSPRFRNLLTLILPLAFGILTAVAAILFAQPGQGSVARHELLERAKSATTYDAKVNFLFEKAVVELVNENRAKADINLKFPKIDAKLLFGLLPLALALAILLYILRYCYPSAVFAWGDAAKSYSTLLERRRNLWGIITIAVIVGVLVNVSSPIISSWMGV